MADENGSNGRVRFGPATGNEMPGDWVQPMLWRLFAAAPGAFRKQLAELAAERMTGGAVTAVAAREPKD